MSTPELSKREQRILARAKDKIKTVNEDMLNSKGLTEAEANAAAKAGLIDPEQKYWWLESWQKGERVDLPVHLKRQKVSLLTFIINVPKKSEDTRARASRYLRSPQVWASGLHR